MRCRVAFLIVFAIVFAGFLFPTSAKTLDTLVIQGLIINSPVVVRNAINFKTGDSISVDMISDAVSALHRLGIFKTIDFFVDNETEATASLRLVVTEFPVIDTIEFSGNKKFKRDELLDKIKIKPGQTVTDAELFGVVATIKKLYSDKGYLLAEIKTESKPAKVPGNMRLKFVIKENTKVQIKQITFSGNKEIKTSKLEHKFKTRIKKWWRSGDFDEELYRAHLDTLVMFYNDLGFLDMQVTRDSFWYGSNQKDLYIEVVINEGRKYYAGDFFFTGNTVISSDSLKNMVALKRGKPFEKSRFDLTKYLLHKAYTEEGYLWVQMAESRVLRGDTIDITFSIVENRAAIVRKVDITGNTKTHEKVIRRELRLYPGQKYRQSLVDRSLRQLNMLGFFGEVRPDIKPNDDGTIDIVFDVPEKENIGQLSLGASYSPVQGFGGTFSTAIPNFRGYGQNLGLNLSYAQNSQSYSLDFKEPWAFETPTSVSGSLFYNRNIYRYTDDTIITQSMGFSVGAARDLKWPDDYFGVSGLYEFSFNSDDRSVPAPFKNISLISDGLKSKLRLKLSRNDCDDPEFPTNGSSFYVEGQIAGLGGDYRYVKGKSGYDIYLPLPLKFVFGIKSKFGLIGGLGDKIILSRYDLFSAGGVNFGSVYDACDIRGYQNLAFGGTPENGITMFALSSELRYPILDHQLYLAGFYDMGNTWGELSQVDLGDLYQGVGAGFRIVVPMLGTMGFDFAWRLKPLPQEKNSVFDRPSPGYEVHFQIGKGF